MGLFDFFRKPAESFFAEADQNRIVEAIRKAESRTSGEIRLYIESRCRFVDPVDRAVELFFGLKMDKTDDRNGVILYIAMRDHQLAIYGDEGIHRKVGIEFWNTEVKRILAAFDRNDYVGGINQIVYDIGEALHAHFPYDRDTDKNELPDEIVFGR